MIFKWTPNFVPNKIFVFGCGGTGSRVVPLVAQFMKSCAWIVQPEVILVDFDIVEEKNLTRQNFIPQDIGKNKAVVLANRYSKAFNITITAITSKVTRSPSNRNEEIALKTFEEQLATNEMRNNIFILCVDSPNARREIVRAIMAYCSKSPNNIVIDAGNENDFGQVTVTSINGLDISSYERELLGKLENHIPVTMDLKYIPIDPAYFDDMATVSTPSCAELDQTMAINTLMAVNIFGIVQNIYYVKSLSFFRIDVSMQYGSIPQHINIDYLKRCMNDFTMADKVASATRRQPFQTDIIKLYDAQEKFKKNMRDQEEKARVAKLEEEAKQGSKIEGIEIDLETVRKKPSAKKPPAASTINAVIDALNSTEPPVITITTNNGPIVPGVTNLVGNPTLGELMTVRR